MSASAFAMSCLILGAIPSDVDVAVIVAGMADLPLRKVTSGWIARGRFGSAHPNCGREFTEHQRFGVPFNHGCAWTHADAANLFVQIADSLGFRKIWTPISPVCLTRLGKCPRRRTCAWTPLTVVYNQ